MTTKHKHYDVIIAFAEGKTVQVEVQKGKWEDCLRPNFMEGLNYRVKPESNTVFCRVARTSNGLVLVSGVRGCEIEDVKGAYIRSPDFVDWITLWIPYKV